MDTQHVLGLNVIKTDQQILRQNFQYSLKPRSLLFTQSFCKQLPTQNCRILFLKWQIFPVISFVISPPQIYMFFSWHIFLRCMEQFDFVETNQRWHWILILCILRVSYFFAQRAPAKTGRVEKLHRVRVQGRFRFDVNSMSMLQRATIFGCLLRNSLKIWAQFN